VTSREQFLARAGRVTAVGSAVGGLLAASVFARSVYLDLIGQRQFRTPIDIALYYGLPAALAVFLFASLKFGPTRRLRLVVFSVAVAVPAYTFELLLTPAENTELQPAMVRLANSKNLHNTAAELTRQSGHTIDLRTLDEALADFRHRGVDAVRTVFPSPLLVAQPDGRIKSTIAIDGREVIPLGTVSNKVTILCNEEGAWIDYRSDSHGFNNPDEIWRSRRVDIAAVGDSFTHGYCVPAGKDLVALIRQRYVATLNLAVAGDGPLLELATLSEYLPRFTPKIVLWFYYEGSDLTDLRRERSSALLGRYLEDDFVQPDLARQADIDRALVTEIPNFTAREAFAARKHPLNEVMLKATAFAKLTALRTGLNLIGETDAKALAIGADLREPNMNAFREVLRHAKTRVAAWGGQLQFIYLPEWARYTRYRTWGTTTHDDVLALVRSLGISIIDLEPVFRAQSDPLSLFPFRGLGHYTEAGHRLVAAEVLRTLHSLNRSDSPEQ
jgi:hypothetical protein